MLHPAWGSCDSAPWRGLSKGLDSLLQRGCRLIGSLCRGSKAGTLVSFQHFNSRCFFSAGMSSQMTNDQHTRPVQPGQRGLLLKWPRRGRGREKRHQAPCSPLMLSHSILGARSGGRSPVFVQSGRLPEALRLTSREVGGVETCQGLLGFLCCTGSQLAATGNVKAQREKQAGSHLHPLSTHRMEEANVKLS